MKIEAGSEAGRIVCDRGAKVMLSEPKTGKGVIANGTRISVPNAKVKWDRGNPTGHGIVFLSRNRYVFCYVQPGGA